MVTALIIAGEAGAGAIPQRTVNELEIGDFVLFREGSDKDVVQLFAEEQVGQVEYRSLRKQANVWREALLASGDTPDRVHRHLGTFGLTKTRATVRNWLHNSNLIGPFAEQDVHIIAEATGENFDDSPSSVWEAIATVRNEHRSAGHKISAWLLEELSDRKYIATTGGKINLGFGDLRIVEVEEIGEELENWPDRQCNRLLGED